MTSIHLNWYDPNENQPFEYSGTLPLTIGRDEDNTIALKGTRVSRRHARIEEKDGQVVMVDLASSNGTLVNGKRIKDAQAPLPDGIQFVIDPFEFRITIVKDKKPTAKFHEPTMVIGLPTPLNQLSDVDSLTIHSILENHAFSKGEVMFQQGDPTDGCYILDTGLIRLELNHEMSNPDDNEDVLTFVEPNSFIGELSLLDRSTRSATAIAHTDITVRKITLAAFEQLMQDHPTIAVVLLEALGRSAAERLRQTTLQLDSLTGSKRDPMVESMIADAERAQQEIARWSEDRIDDLLQALAQAIYEKSEVLAQEAVRETGIGNVIDKTIKNHVASLGVLQTLTGQRGFGLLEGRDSVREIASPVGIVFGLVPVTNPTSTFIFKTLIAIKSRNAIILSPNRRAADVSNHVGDIIRAVLHQHNAPEKIVQWVEARANRKLTITFMNHKKVGLILATGGSAMVKAAYSSGNPAIGVGPGNAPTLITASADLHHAANSIVMSKSFDNGLICGAEHNLVVEKAVFQPFTEALLAAGAAILSPEETTQFANTTIDPKINGFKETFVGKEAAYIAQATGIQRPYPIHLIVVPWAEVNAKTPFAHEKMLPVLSLFTVKNADEGLEICRQLLMIDGQGHTAIIYTQDDHLIERFGVEMPASRILVNSPGAHGVVGIATALMPSLTLGCGTFGGNSTTDNVGYTHLLNIKHLAYFTPERAAQFLNS
jgi:acyl-CoA reductase-like NAD-dependent aldehyde dehydrogenase/pSer/pThr/pTyr-binding forkhead associated (FHA) protein